MAYVCPSPLTHVLGTIKCVSPTTSERRPDHQMPWSRHCRGGSRRAPAADLIPALCNCRQPGEPQVLCSFNLGGVELRHLRRPLRLRTPLGQTHQQSEGSEQAAHATTPKGQSGLDSIECAQNTCSEGASAELEEASHTHG